MNLNSGNCVLLSINCQASLINVGAFFSFFISGNSQAYPSFSPARATSRNSRESANFTLSMWPIESVDYPSFNKECDFFSHTVSRKDKNKKTFLMPDWILIERSYKWRHQFQAIKLLVAWNFLPCLVRLWRPPKSAWRSLACNHSQDSPPPRKCQVCSWSSSFNFYFCLSQASVYIYRWQLIRLWKQFKEPLFFFGSECFFCWRKKWLFQT